MKENILCDILSKHKAEVTNMLLTEYDEAAHIENEKRWSYEDGENRGLEKGVKASIDICKKLNLSYEDTLMSLTDAYDLDDNNLKTLLDRYWS